MNIKFTAYLYRRVKYRKYEDSYLGTAGSFYSVFTQYVRLQQLDIWEELILKVSVPTG